MRINALRKELKASLTVLPLRRAPVIRRSFHEDWLYATDLPVLCPAREREAVLQTLSCAGWEYKQEGDWIQLRKPSEQPPEGWYGGPFGTEAACCLSLLERHATKTDGTAEAVQRILIKAAEEGDKAYNSACAEIHRNWAERLRKKEPLPAVHRCYFSRREG